MRPDIYLSFDLFSQENCKTFNSISIHFLKVHYNFVFHSIRFSNKCQYPAVCDLQWPTHLFRFHVARQFVRCFFLFIVRPENLPHWLAGSADNDACVIFIKSMSPKPVFSRDLPSPNTPSNNSLQRHIIITIFSMPERRADWTRGPYTVYDDISLIIIAYWQSPDRPPLGQLDESTEIRPEAEPIQQSYSERR